MIHKKTLSFIRDLGEDNFIGECAFFSMNPRAVTARSKRFTQVIKLEREEFLLKADNYPEVMV